MTAAEQVSPPAATGAALDTWWQTVTAAALVGTGRRPPPSWPSYVTARRDSPTGEQLVLDAAALLGSLRAAGLPPVVVHPGPACETEALPAAPARAVRLLEVALTQSPAGARLRDQLVTEWLAAAARTGHRLPAATLPEVLELARSNAVVRRAALPALGNRGRWLAELNPAWSAVTDDGDAATDAARLVAEWPTLPTTTRVSHLRRLRSSDPSLSRELLASTWGTDPAKDRAGLLETFRQGLSISDEPILEAALDDRAASVRDIAAGLLDGLPSSQRAARMAERLRGLVSTTGVVRHRVSVELPDEPDAAGLRDGLGTPPGRRSRRGWWLERIVTGAPLGWWAETGLEPSRLLARLDSGDVLAGLRAATLSQRDAAWAAALLERRWDAELLGVLPDAERDRVVTRHLAGKPELGQLPSVLTALATPWSADLSQQAMARLTEDPAGAVLLGQLTEVLVRGLHPDALPFVERRLADGRLPDRTGLLLRQLLQFHSFVRSTNEAFS